MNNFPFFPDQYLKKDLNNEDNFHYYLNYTNKMVLDIQSNNLIHKKELPLTFYPIAKNVSIVTSHMAQNILEGSSSIILNKARNGEEYFWEENCKLGNWFPWLWARGRIDGNYTNKEGWTFYFEDIEKINNIYNGEETLEPPREQLKFFVYLSCLNYIFNPNTKYTYLFNDYKEQMKWPSFSNILAVQIRRGDSSNKNGSKSNRPFFNINTYVEKIEILMKENNYEYIYVSTDSDEEIEQIIKLKPEWKLLFLPIDRKNFFRMQEDRIRDIEEVCCNDINRIPFVVDSALADLFFISLCQGYVATIAQSVFSRLGWYLQIAKQKNITPYVNLDIRENLLDINNRDILFIF